MIDKKGKAILKICEDYSKIFYLEEDRLTFSSATVTQLNKSIIILFNR